MSNQGTLQHGLFIQRKPSLYNPSQVSQWLSCLKFPQTFGEDDLVQGIFPTTLKNLATLVRLHAVTFLYEDTQLHYSSDHVMDVEPQGLFQRLVIDRRGSYCFGMNILFLNMLRGLGYRAYSGLGRINQATDPEAQPVYTGLSHMVIFVQPGEENVTYLVDAGCGGSGPTSPILLSDEEDNVVMGTTPTEKHRLRRGGHWDSSLGHQLHSPSTANTEWIVQVLHEKPEKGIPAWRIAYMFSEGEVFPKDLELQNRGVYTAETGFFADSVMCSRHQWLQEGDDGNESIEPSERELMRIGLMGRVLKKFMGSTSELIKLIDTEEERVEALRTYFGISLSREEVEHIRGRRAAI